MDDDWIAELYPWLRQHAGRIGRRFHVECDDLVQIVAIRLFEQFHRSADSGKSITEHLTGLRWYALRALENEARSQIRRRSAQKRRGLKPDLLSSTTAWDREGKGLSPEDEAIMQEADQNFKVALSQLPEDVQHLVEMKLFQDLTFTEIAEETGLHFHAVYRKIHKGIAVLERAVLEE